MVHHFRTLFIAMALGTLTGCATLPPPAEGLVSAYSIGDAARVGFDEVVVSLPFRGTNAPYQNLHVAVTVFINAARPTDGKPHEASGIVQACEARIATQVSQVLGDRKGEHSLEDNERLREAVRAEARKVIEPAVQRWKHGSDYVMEVAVLTLYWTDASVGAPANTRGGFGRW